MKKFLILGLCILFVLGLSGCVSQVDNIVGPRGNDTLPSRQVNMTKIVLASGEWSPYVSENLKYEGVVSRIVTEAFALVNVETEYVYMPWKSSMEEAKNGTWHGTFPWLKNEEREGYFYFSSPIAHENVLFFYKKDSGFSWETVSDLKDYKIGGTAGYYYGELFNEAEKNGKITIERVIDDETNFKRFVADEVDVIICEIDVCYAIMERLLSSEEANNIIHYPKSISENPLYLLLSKQLEGNDELVELFNMGLKRLEESGKIDQYWEESRQGEYKKE